MKKLFLLSVILALFVGNNYSQAQPKGINAEYLLSWDVCPTANTVQYRAEHYSVWISTTGNTPGDFTTMLFEETLSTEHTNWVYENRQVNIDDYAGSNVYVAFRHHDITDMDRIVIDNVKLYRVNDGDEDEVIYLFEDFQGGIGNPQGEDWLPEGWIAVDADGDSFNWYFGEREGEGAMRSQSWDGDPLTPDNYLITSSVFLGTVGINQFRETVINVFPNPATSTISIQSDVPIHQIELVNMLGAIVLSEKTDASNLKVDVSQQDLGMYFLRLHTGNGVETRKINISR
ncbi:MAG: choice-of-anchor J domain-containing protein [Bacteroidales bacterium]|nr:choice-of-anchor J domain-containing protein [Bacteroidales bacterium]